MIRLIIDNFEGAHNNLFLIIDSRPWHIKVADSYYLFDFLEINDDQIENLNLQSNEVLKYGANTLLNYWKDRIKAVEIGQQKFIPFDLSDQYIGGLLFEKIKNNYKVKLVVTDKIQGFGIGKSNLDEEIIMREIEFKESESYEWLMSEEGILNGIEWSIEELSNRIR